MTYFPKNAVIPNKVCIVGGQMADGLYGICFNPKVRTPPCNTIAIIKNLLSGSFKISELSSNSHSFYSSLHMKDVLPSGLILKTDIQYWSLNEIIMSGFLEKGGKVKDGIEFVAVTYSGHSTVILKDGQIYNAIMGKSK
jgi:hypothetical protein